MRGEKHGFSKFLKNGTFESGLNISFPRVERLNYGCILKLAYINIFETDILIKRELLFGMISLMFCKVVKI